MPALSKNATTAVVQALLHFLFTRVVVVLVTSTVVMIACSQGNDVGDGCCYYCYQSYCCDSRCHRHVAVALCKLL